jgi:hypothetical protein
MTAAWSEGRPILVTLMDQRVSIAVCCGVNPSAIEQNSSQS